MKNRFIKVNELKKILKVKTLRMGKYGVFVDEFSRQKQKDRSEIEDAIQKVWDACLGGE